METAEIKRRWLEFFANTRPHRRAVGVLLLDDPNLLFVNAGMVPFKPYFLGQETAAVHARHQRAEVRAHPRHRGGRQDHAARHVLPDERQLLLRRLLQGRRHRARLGAGHPVAGRRRLRLPRVQAAGHRSTRTTTRRSGSGARSPACPTSASSGWARRTTTGTWACPAPAARAARSSSTAGRSTAPRATSRRRGPLPRVLEPRLHAVRARRRAQQGRLRHPRRPARPRTSTPAWASSGSPSCCRASTTSTRSTRSARSSTARPSSRARRTAPAPRRRRTAAGRRRPRAQRADAHQRRRHPGQRGARLRAAPADPPRVRSMRLLGVDDPVLPELLPVSRDAMAPSYPELATGFERISSLAYAEEEAFRHTLRAGTTTCSTRRSRETKSQGGTSISGDRAFQLHDTYGFPIDLTLEMAAEQGLDGRRGRLPPADARAARAGPGRRRRRRSSGSATSPPTATSLDGGGRDDVHRLRRGRLARRPCRGLLVGGAGVPAASEGDDVELVLDRTPFYAEGGGQLADQGRILLDNGADGRGPRRPDADPRPDRAPRPGRQRRGRRRRHGRRARSTSSAAGRSAARTRPPTWCTRRSAQALGETATQAGSENAPGRLPVRLLLARGRAAVGAARRRAGGQRGPLRRPATVRAEIMSQDAGA